jgi:hypothetical protein
MLANADQKLWRRQDVKMCPDDGYFATQNVDQHWKLIEPAADQDTPKSTCRMATATSKP